MVSYADHPRYLSCITQAVGVHCAEGRGRTGVMCACYLIYYYDMEPWDAIRIMRRQRPGSVERKVRIVEEKRKNRTTIVFVGTGGHSGPVPPAAGGLRQGQHRQVGPEGEAAHGDAKTTAS